MLWVLRTKASVWNVVGRTVSFSFSLSEWSLSFTFRLAVPGHARSVPGKLTVTVFTVYGTHSHFGRVVTSRRGVWWTKNRKDDDVRKHTEIDDGRTKKKVVKHAEKRSRSNEDRTEREGKRRRKLKAESVSLASIFDTDL